MAVTGHVFPQAQLGLATAKMNWTSDTLKMALSDVAGPVTLATSGVQAAKLWTDWTTNVAAEITGTGYTAGGASLASVTCTVSGDVLTLTATSPQWTSATLTANQAILYDSTASTVQLIAFWDFGGAISVTSGTFTATINASGLYTCTVT
jgi:hypothetical protein